MNRFIVTVITDGGRLAAGYKGHTGDCVARAIAIAAELPYGQVYGALAVINYDMPKSKRRQRGQVGRVTASHGIYTKSRLFKRYMTSLGFTWTPTMFIGSGCKVHLRKDELPDGRLIAMVSRHCCAIINGVIFDTHDPSRGGTRCVYGYWRKEVAK